MKKYTSGYRFWTRGQKRGILGLVLCCTLLQVAYFVIDIPTHTTAFSQAQLLSFQERIDSLKSQEQAQLQAQQKFQQDLVAAVQAKDNKKVQEAIDTFNKSVQSTIASLDALDVKADSVKSVKEQTKNVLNLASSLLVEQANVSLASPSEAQQKVYLEKAEKLKDAMLELQKQSVALEQKFNPAPAVPAQQAKFF